MRKTHDISLMDEIVRKFFSNFSVKVSDKGKEQIIDVVYELKEPWKSFIKTEDFERGRG